MGTIWVHYGLAYGNTRGIFVSEALPLAHLAVERASDWKPFDFVSLNIGGIHVHCSS
jgi:hypothetical protein